MCFQCECLKFCCFFCGFCRVFKKESVLKLPIYYTTHSSLKKLVKRLCKTQGHSKIGIKRSIKFHSKYNANIKRPRKTKYRTLKYHTDPLNKVAILTSKTFAFNEIKLIKDSRREKIISNETPVLTKSMNMGICVVCALNQLFTRGCYTEAKFSKN